MSNPAVLKLQDVVIGEKRFCIEDNIGEAIHIHIDDEKFEFSIKEFDDLVYSLKECINNLVDIDNFDINKIDSIYYQVILSDEIHRLKEIKKDTINLGKVKVYHHKQGLTLLKDSVGVKELEKKETWMHNEHRESNWLGETEIERMNRIKNSIIENGYPYDNNYLIFYNDSMKIADGQHRASCLYYLYGEIDVPVLRFYFEDQIKEEKSISYKEKMILGLRKKKYWLKNYVLKIFKKNDKNKKGCSKEVLEIFNKCKY